jgi:periplasmic divalent cation tolerance protein
MEGPVVVFITTPSIETGEQIARLLVERKLAACVNILPAMQSVYRWEGKVERAQETLLIVKTRAEIFESQLLAAVTEAHPYQVPEIIALPIQAGLPAYLSWIDEETQ